MDKAADICQVRKTRNNTTAPRRDFCCQVCADSYRTWWTELLVQRARG